MNFCTPHIELDKLKLTGYGIKLSEDSSEMSRKFPGLRSNNFAGVCV
jgi:hypothetical protein